MQKYILKQQFEGFTVSNTDGIHKGYERFQSLLSQLEIHGAGVSTEDANQKFLRSLPSAWLQVSLIMRNKPGMDSLSFDDLYNNLRVFENDVKGSTASSSNLQNVAFVSENTNSTNEVSTAYGVSNTSGHCSKHEQTSTSSYSLLASQSSCPQLDHEDLDQVDEYDLEEMDLKWQVAMISMRIKKFYKKTGRKLQFDAKEPVGFDKTKVECYNCHKTGHFARECRTKEENRRRDGWNTGNREGRRTGNRDESITGRQLMENVLIGQLIQKIMKILLSWLATAQDQTHSDASVEIKAYTQGLKKVEAQLVAHQQGQLWDKFGLGYGDYRYSGNLSYENEVFQSVFRCNKSDSENLPLHKRLAKTGEMQAVPPPMTGNYLPSGPDIEIDDSQYTYGPEKTQPSESESQTTELDTCNSNISTEPSELVSEPVVNETNVEVQPKVWSDAPIIEEYESDSDDECVTVQTKELDTPSFANKQIKTPRENVKNQSTHSQKPKVNNKELGNGVTERACFVCGSFSHLIRDCDYHVKLAKQVELNKQNMSKGNGTGVRKPTWNNGQRVNQQNQFVTLAVQTRTGINPVNTAKASSTKRVSTARQNVNRQTVLISTALKVNTVKPFVNDVRPTNVFHKTHSPSTKPFKRTTVLKTNLSNQKVYTVKVKEVSTVGEKWDTADNPHRNLQNKGIIDSGCSRHMTGNKAYLADFQDFNGGPVAFGGSKGYITGKGKIKTGKLDFEDVSFVKELQPFNLFSVSQMCDKKNKVLFTDSECLVLSPDFKLPDENQILLKVPRQNNMYSFNLENIVPLGGLACLIAKATTDESNLWHRRLGHVNFKNLNRLVKGNLVRGLPTKLFQNYHTCVACQKGKQHKASCKAQLVSSFSHPLQLLHMDLFGPTSVRSINHKTYCLVITDDFNRFSWTFFLRTKDETNTTDVSYTFTYDDEGAEADFYKFETVVKFMCKIAKEKHIIRLVDAMPEELLQFEFKGLDLEICLMGKRILKYPGKSTKWLKLYMGLHPSAQEHVQSNVDDIIFGSTKKSWCDEFEALMKSRFQMSSMGELSFFLGLQVKQNPNGIFISQNKITDGSLMYVTASRPDIMFAVCAVARFQVTPKTSHLSAVKRIFRYLKGKPKLGLWYPRESSFDLESYLDSDYAGANLDRKSTTGGCQFLGRRLITWQCKKQTIVATSTTEAEYVAAASCCGQVLWIQNQMLDYGFNFMNTKIYIDNESTICIVKNPVYHSKTKHIAIRHHFIRDAYEKKLIQVLKIHTDDNVADLLTKAFDVSRLSVLVVFPLG
ncbi:putative ribonuclease H-like domain-containing protein [Tanacetum coccineum]